VSIEQLAGILRERGHSAHVEIGERIPGRYGLTWAEQVTIFIGSGAATSLLNGIVSDVYSTTKDWARKRFKKRQSASTGGKPRPLRFTVYGPDNERLLSWKIDFEGEHEDIPADPKDDTNAASMRASDRGKYSTE
jgi:hypothetical protein